MSWIPSSLKKSMGKYSDIDGEESANLLHTLIWICKQFAAKLDFLRRAVQHGMHVMTYPDYSTNDSESPRSPLTIKVSLPNFPNLFLTPLCEVFATYIDNIKDSTAVFLIFCKLSTWRRSAKGNPQRNSTHVSLPDNVVLIYWWKILRKWLMQYSRWNGMESKWVNCYEGFAKVERKFKVITYQNDYSV